MALNVVKCKSSHNGLSKRLILWCNWKLYSILVEMKGEGLPIFSLEKCLKLTIILRSSKDSTIIWRKNTINEVKVSYRLYYKKIDAEPKNSVLYTMIYLKNSIW